MAQEHVELTSLFRAVTQTLEQNQQALDQADEYNQDHGTNMVKTFKTITNSLEKKRGQPDSTALAYAARQLSKTSTSTSGKLYAQGLATAATQFKGKQVDQRGAMDLLQTLIGGGQATQQSSGSGDMLSSLLGGMLGGGQAPQQSSGGDDMLGSLLGGMLGGGQTSQQPSGGGDMLGSLLGGMLGGEQPAQQSSGGGDLLSSLLGGMSQGGGAQQPQQPAGGGDLLSSLLGGMADSGQTQQQQPSSGGDLLGSLLGGMGGGSGASSGSGSNLGNLLNAGLSFMQAKQSGKSTLQALIQAFMAYSGMGGTRHRQQSTEMVVGSFLQALGAAGQ